MAPTVKPDQKNAEENLIFIFESEPNFNICLVLNFRNFVAYSLELTRVCMCEEFGLRGLEVSIAIHGKKKACWMGI
jgi:hypothetical protein